MSSDARSVVDLPQVNSISNSDFIMVLANVSNTNAGNCSLITIADFRQKLGI